MLLKSRILSAKRFNDIFTMKKIPQEKLNSKSLLQTLNQVYQNRQVYINCCAKQDWIDGTNKIINYLK